MSASCPESVPIAFPNHPVFRDASTMHPFLFATGIENSYPKRSDGTRVDEMEACGHYARWEEDFALVREVGVDALRYGPPYYRIHVGAGRFDWSLADDQMHRLRSLGIEAIADLCHFGVPDWLNGFQDPAFPVLFADYARAFARRYPWVRYYTPVNEIFIAASFSALYGYWNECLESEAAFVTALRNLCMAHEHAVDAILAERPDAVIVQSESLEEFHPAGRISQSRAEKANGLKLLSLDLTLGVEPAPGMMGFLNDNGVTSNDLSFFRERRGRGRRWLGLDYYPTCEHRIATSGRFTVARNGTGFFNLAKKYHARYGIPLFHCETNRVSRKAVDWLHQQWSEVSQLRSIGIPVHGFTWYSLTDQIDWQHALRFRRDDVYPVGLYDLERRIRPVGAAYRRLIESERATIQLQESETAGLLQA